MCPKTNSTESVEHTAIRQSISSTPFESLLTLQQATQIIPRANGKHYTSATVWRWCRKGIRGVCLRHVCVGKSILTTEAALHEFFAELAKSQRPLTSAPVISRSVSKLTVDML